MNIVLETASFVLAFIPLRVTVGGYHAKRHMLRVGLRKQGKWTATASIYSLSGVPPDTPRRPLRRHSLSHALRVCRDCSAVYNSCELCLWMIREVPRVLPFGEIPRIRSVLSRATNSSREEALS